ncbi:hypothetical protein C0992_005107 [Termitomyces sp. T32_za158]|nr:hypothetical protein C0992_005107 [Termitomyces sp. T32_za158]
MAVFRLSLPTELARKIIVNCLLDPEFYTDPFDLARVSRQWRGIINAENSLWETLHITWLAGPNGNYYLLHPCTRIAPFGVRAQELGNSQDLLKRAQTWLACSRNVDAKLSLSLETDGTEPKTLLPAFLKQYRNRLRQLSLTTSMSTVMHFIRCIKELKDGQVAGESLFPYLEVFEFHVIYRSAPGTTLRGLQRLDLSQLPALKCLKIRGFKGDVNRQGFLSWKFVTGIPFTQLVSLSLEDRKISFTSTRTILEKCIHLEEFSALIEQESESSGELPYHPSTFPNLRIMSVFFLPNSYACGFVARFFRLIHTPTLKELTVDAQYAIDESTELASMVSHMLRPSHTFYSIQALTLSVDLTMDSIISMLRDFSSLRYLRLCAPVRGGPGETYLRCGYLQVLEMMTQAQNGYDLPLLEEIFIEDNVSSEVHRMTTLLLEDGKVNPGLAHHLGLVAIQSFVESRCKPEVHIGYVSITWKNVGRDWSSAGLETVEYKCPYNHPALKVKENSVEIVVKCFPHRQHTSEVC